MNKILLIEDDISLCNGLSFAFKKEQYQLDVTHTILETEEQLSKNSLYDLIIIDVTLPDGSGFDICKKIRQTSKVPIMFLTASDEEIDIVRGLDIGADDYVTKPFKLGILMSRINALLRRSKNFDTNINELYSNDIKVLLLERQVYKNNQLLELTTAEYKLLCLFMQNPNLILSKTQILEKLWDIHEHYVDDNTLSVYIRRLRCKIEDNPSEPKKIITVRRMGYKWSCL